MFAAVKFLWFFYFELFVGENFCTFLRHDKVPVSLVGGGTSLRDDEFAVFWLTVKIAKVSFNAKISCLRVL